MLGELFAVMAPVFFGASLGFGWVRLGHDYPVEFVTRLVFNIGTPTLILASLNGADIDPGSFGRTQPKPRLAPKKTGAITAKSSPSMRDPFLPVS